MSEPLSRERLDAIRERAEAATKGPWRSHDFGHAGEEEPSSIVVHVGKFDHSDLLTYDTETAVAWMPRWERQESDDAAFIAHARTDVPDLLAEVERLLGAVAEWPESLPGGLSSNGARAWLQDRVDGLLNPTEGEDHECDDRR